MSLRGNSGPCANSAARSPLWAEFRRDRARCDWCWSSGGGMVRGGVLGRVQPPSRLGGSGGGGGDASLSGGPSRGGSSGGGLVGNVGEEGCPCR
ncbi:hypothetical protein MRX96_025158 [Rhipicephalus microplus]